MLWQHKILSPAYSIVEAYSRSAIMQVLCPYLAGLPSFTATPVSNPIASCTYNYNYICTHPEPHES